MSGRELREPAWVPDIRRARTLLVEALLVDDHRERYLQAHQAVAWAADAAMLGRTGRRLPVEADSPWPLVAQAMPGLGEWADFFTLTERRRLTVLARHTRVSEREADDLVRAADQFCEAVVACLGLPRATARDVGRTG